MREPSAEKERWIRKRVSDLCGRSMPLRLRLVDDTTDFMAVDRDHLIELGKEIYLITGIEREERFGLVGEPKPWVKRGISLTSGRTHILKLVFPEVFRVTIGAESFRCARSAEKEARVLDVIDGKDLYTKLLTLDLPHEDYLALHFPGVLDRVIESLAAIQRLHDAGLCHGDIRNDHIFVENRTGTYRWIDFDLDQNTPAFDLWSVGNILHFVVGKGVTRSSQVLDTRPDLRGRLRGEDAALFFPYRLQNLGKLYPSSSLHQRGAHPLCGGRRDAVRPGGPGRGRSA